MRRERSAGNLPGALAVPRAPTVLSTFVRLRPTARGAAVVAVLVGLVVAAVVTRNPALVVFVVVLGVPLATAPWLAASRTRRAQAAQARIMVAPPLVPVDGPCDLILQLANDADTPLPPLSLDGPAEHSRSVAGRTVSDRPPSRVLLAASPSRLLRWEALEAHGCASSTRKISTRRRGVFVVGPLRLWAHDPFGLVGAVVTTTRSATVVVHPQPTPAAPLQLLGAGRPAAGTPRSGEVRMPSDDPAGEWSGLRPYAPGDRLHLLSWPAEALHGALLVHEFRPDGQAGVRIVLDDRPGVHHRDAFEAVLSAVYAFVLDADRRALDVELAGLSGDESVRAHVPEGMVEHLTFLARALPQKQPGRARSGRATPEGVRPSVVVTTATARPSLPPLPGDPAVVVVG